MPSLVKLPVLSSNIFLFDINLLINSNSEDTRSSRVEIFSFNKKGISLIALFNSIVFFVVSAIPSLQD